MPGEPDNGSCLVLQCWERDAGLDVMGSHLESVPPRLTRSPLGSEFAWPVFSSTLSSWCLKNSATRRKKVRDLSTDVLQHVEQGLVRAGILPRRPHDTWHEGGEIETDVVFVSARNAVAMRRSKGNVLAGRSPR